jgi:hypothetical protein
MMRVRGMVYLWTLCILLLPAWSAWGQPFYTVTDLGSMIPLAINEDGVIVGSASIAGVQTPVSWVAGHQTPLATLGAGGRADAITRTLEAVGYVLTTPIATQQAFQWDAQGRLTLLPGVTSDPASAATAKNEAGWIAGYDDIPDQGGPLIRAKRWSPLGVVENLAPAGGSDSSLGPSTPQIGYGVRRKQPPRPTRHCGSRKGHCTTWACSGGSSRRSST